MLDSEHRTRSTLPVSSSDPFEGLREGTDIVACHCVREAFLQWKPHASRTAKSLSALAVGLFTTAVVTGIVEDKDALWKSSLAVVGLLVVLTAVSSVFACRHATGEARDDQRRSGQQETPADFAAYA